MKLKYEFKIICVQLSSIISKNKFSDHKNVFATLIVMLSYNIWFCMISRFLKIQRKTNTMKAILVKYWPF